MDGTVKAFNECIVVWPPDSTVANGGAVCPEYVLEFSGVLRAVVGLYYLEVKASVGLASSNDLRSQSGAQVRMVLNVCPP